MHIGGQGVAGKIYSYTLRENLFIYIKYSTENDTLTHNLHIPVQWRAGGGRQNTFIYITNEAENGFCNAHYTHTCTLEGSGSSAEAVKITAGRLSSRAFMAVDLFESSSTCINNLHKNRGEEKAREGGGGGLCVCLWKRERGREGVCVYWRERDADMCA